MAKLNQVISPERIVPVAKKIDSIQYFGGRSIDPETDVPSERQGTANIESRIVGNGQNDNEKATRQLTVTLSISSDDDPNFYSLSIAASGLYQATEKMPDDELDRLVLTAGFNDLYSYIRDRVSIIMQGGIYGEVEFPVLSASAQE